MEKIKKYFKNLLIGLATMVLSNLQSNTTPTTSSGVINVEEDDDIHMYI